MNYKGEHYLDVFVTNIGAYAAGELKGEWLKLPTDKATLQNTFERIGLSEGGEYFITDYNSTLTQLTGRLGEYENLNELNYLAVKLEELSRNGDLEKFEAALQLEGNNLKDVINLTENLENFDLLPEVSNETDLGRYVVKNGGYDLEAMGELVDYLDYNAIGRDTLINEGGVFTVQGYISEESSITEYYESIDDIPQEHLVTPYMTGAASEPMTETVAETISMV